MSLVKLEQQDMTAYLRKLIDTFQRILFPRTEPKQPPDIAYEGDFQRITLRECLVDKLVVGTGVVRLLVTAYADVAFLLMLLAMFHVPLPERFLGLEIPKDMGFESPFDRIFIGFFAFLVLILTWDLIGRTRWLLHSFFGCDIIEIGPGVWKATRKTGPFHRTRTFDPADGWIAILGNDDELAAAQGKKVIRLSTLGVTGERLWICDEIRSRYSTPMAQATVSRST